MKKFNKKTIAVNESNASLEFAKAVLGETETVNLLVDFGFTEKAAFDMSLQANKLAQDLVSFINV